MLLRLLAEEEAKEETVPQERSLLGRSGHTRNLRVRDGVIAAALKSRTDSSADLSRWRSEQPPSYATTPTNTNRSLPQRRMFTNTL